MKVYLSEISDQGSDYSFTEEQAWLAAAVARIDERIEGELTAPSKPRPIAADLNLRKVNEVIVAQGRVKSSIRLFCSRCATPYYQDCESRFSGLFCRDPAMAGVGHIGALDQKPHGQIRGVSRPNHSEEDSEKDLDITYISNETIDLADVLAEQLLLQIPFRPLCRSDCQGICPQCGTDLNQGRCACAKLASGGSFSALKDLRIPAAAGSVGRARRPNRV